MALINCPECGRQVSDQAQTCPECGHPIKRPEAVRHVPPIVVQQPGKRGCLWWVGALVVGIIVLTLGGAFVQGFTGASATPTPQASFASGQAATKPSPTPLATVGQTVQLGGWQVTLMDFGPYDRFDQRKPSTSAQGKRVVADMRIKNLQNSTSNFTTNDFELRTGDGRTFKPDGVTASIERGFGFSQTVQPSLTTDNRVVFDLDPTAVNLTFTALKIIFRVPNP